MKKGSNLIKKSTSDMDETQDVTNVSCSGEKQQLLGKSNTITSNVREVINLDDDDDDDGLSKGVKKKKLPTAKCMNPNCFSGQNLAQPANFVLTYFGMKRTKDQLVCTECFDMVEAHNMKLMQMFKDGQSLYSCEFPQKKDVILLDSDEEDVQDEGGVLSADIHSVIEENIDDVIGNIYAKYDIEFQINEATDCLANKIDSILESANEIDSTFDRLQKTVDKMRKQIYDEYRHPIKELEELMIVDCEIQSDGESLFGERHHKMPQPRRSMGSQQIWAPTKKVTQFANRSSFSEGVNQDVVALNQEKGVPPPDLPPIGLLVRPKLKLNDLVYVMKVSFFSTWVLARIIEITPKADGGVPRDTYRVRMESPAQRKAIPIKNVVGRYLAYTEMSTVRLPVGTRVIAIFKEEGQPINKENYYSGIVAEPPKSMNKYRYLIFFDDGYAQYVPHENVRLVCECSKNVWEDIHPEPRDFIRNYLQQFPERPMVKLQRGQIVKTEWNGRWWIVRVLEVDGSLVKVHFDADSRTEWIYRGSTRLGPLYQEIAAARDRQQSGTLARSRGFGAAKQNNLPYVEYTRTDDDKKDDDNPELVPTRSVAKKSTAKKSEDKYIISNAFVPKPLVSQIPEGMVEVKLLVNPLEPIKFRSHECTNHCVLWTDYNPNECKVNNPLAIPLMHAFQRLICRFRNKRVVMYVTPCGRRIRSYPELHHYLRQTECLLTVDFFDFDFWISCTTEFHLERTFTHIEDLSYGKENIPISCVNDLDHNMPPYVQYMTERQPSEGVHLNLDKNFLIGCDCTDDCQNKETCSCWQLTYAGAKFCNFGQPADPFGYQYRRLPERVITGIYECNPQCKCASTCLNRVAQQPLTTRLQLFKTAKKGWGIRTLCDIPRGAFICIYAGFLLTEQAANEGGKNYGDEYLAELDYIEVVERLKEDYESDVPRELLEDSDDNSKDSLSDRDIRKEDIVGDFDSQDSLKKTDSDEEFITHWREERAMNAESIRTRLRARNSRFNSTDDTDNEKEEKEIRRSRRSVQNTNEETISISDEDTSSNHGTIIFGTNCGDCGLLFPNLKDRIKCSGSCEKTFHTACCSVRTLERLSKLGSKRSSWMCLECKLEVQAQRKPSHFNANVLDQEEYVPKYPSVRDMYGEDESVYIMDAKTNGNIGRYLNHSCNPNVFVQNVFVDTHDLRFPWVAFFSLNFINAGSELTWDYNYDVGSVPGKILHCYCGSNNCRGRLL